MSCHGICPVHGLGTNQETTEALQPDLTYLSYPYNLLPCCGQCPQPSMFDSFGTTGLPPITWAESEQNDQTTYLAEDPEYLMLQPAIEDQNAVAKPSSGGDEVKQAISDLQDRVEKLERNLGNLRKEQEEDRERYYRSCVEIKANNEKLKDWTTDVNRRVSSLPGGHSKSK